MHARFQTAARWVLVLVSFSVTSFVLFILVLGVMFWPDRSLVAAFTALGITPRATIEAAHRLDFFLAILIWVVPSTRAVGFAARTSQRRSLRVALSVSVLLFATVCFFLSRNDHSALMERIAVIAGVIVLGALIFSFFRSNFPRSHTFANFIAVLLLFAPSLVALSRRTGAAPQPKQLWSSTLQQEQSQSMNTGSEYAATRQVAFAADRVIVVFNAGFAPSQPPKDKWPVSTYQLVSLEVKTGAKRNQITFPGRWGAMPYIYPMRGDLISVQSSPPRSLNAELMPVSEATGAATAPPQQQECGASCQPPTYALTEKTVLQLQQRHFQVRDSTGQVFSRGNLVEWGSFAGASADGQRFAIQSSYTEGDPDFVVYEYFTIYRVATGKALATIHIEDLPARQSWSAFSPDGRYFVAGNPNKLAMYELP
jgi:hypothetical protein